MTTRVVKEGNVTTTVVDMTNGVGGRSAEVGQTGKEGDECVKEKEILQNEYNIYYNKQKTLSQSNKNIFKAWPSKDRVQAFVQTDQQQSL